MFASRARGVTAAIMALAGVAAMAQTSTSPAPQTIRANGTEVSYVSEGSGAPVVFVHGAVIDLRFWEPQRAAFAKQYRFISYSQRYHGLGAWPDDGKQYSAETHAADLAAFIQALKVGPVHLVGLSYGGTVAALLATKEPQLLRTLTLAEPGLFALLADSPEGKVALEEWTQGTMPMMAALKAGDNVGATKALAALVMGDSVDNFDKLALGLRVGLLDNARTLPLLFAAPPPTLTCDTLRGIKVPTLVIRGERTPRFFTATNAAVSTCIAGSTAVTIRSSARRPGWNLHQVFELIHNMTRETGRVEGSNELPRGLKPVGGILGQGLEHDPLEGRGYVRVELSQRYRILFDDLSHHIDDRSAGERTNARQRLVEHNAEGENVCSRIYSLASRLLRSHVPRRA